MPNLLGLGEEFEAVLVSVLGYLVMGVVIFFTCFVISKIIIWHRQYVIRKKRLLLGLEDAEAVTFAGMMGRRRSRKHWRRSIAPQIVVSIVESARIPDALPEQIPRLERGSVDSAATSNQFLDVNHGRGRSGSRWS